jgi:NADH-quinone oxidoreductase subunit C
MEERDHRLEQAGEERGITVALAPAITDLEQLKDRPILAELLRWDPRAIEGARLDRDELSIYIRRELIRHACTHLKIESLVDFLSDLTCADFYPREPRFEMAYHLLSIRNKQRVRLKVRLAGEDAVLESLTPLWPGANFFEREVFDLFGIRFLGHPYLRRIMMPEDWEGHPLRRDYPVEGYR